MDQQKLDDLRDLLESEHASIEEELAAHGRPVPEGAAENWQGSTGDLTGEEADPTDAADKIEELITNVPLVEQMEARYKEVAAAIARMDAGTYGICEVCAGTIAEERLEANPAARTCLLHTR